MEGQRRRGWCFLASQVAALAWIMAIAEAAESGRCRALYEVRSGSVAYESLAVGQIWCQFQWGAARQPWRAYAGCAEGPHGLQTLRHQNQAFVGGQGTEANAVGPLEAADHRQLREAEASFRGRLKASIDAEVATLQAQGEEAAQLMTDLVTKGPAAMETVAEPSGNADAWEEMVEQMTSEPAALDFMRQAYAAVQLAQRQQGAAHPAGLPGLGIMPPQLMERLVGCPPAGGPGAPPPGLAGNEGAGGMTVPAPTVHHHPAPCAATSAAPEMAPAIVMDGVPPMGYAAMSPGQARHKVEPYPPASPLASMPPKPEEHKTSEAIHGPQSAAHPGVLPPRESVKDATKHPPPKPVSTSLGLGQKLEQRREIAKAAALRPFGLPRQTGEVPGGHTAAADTGPPGVEGAPNFVEDDPDEMRGVSPGFGGME